MTGDWRADIVDRVRAVILAAEPDMVEEAKWRKASNPDGVPTFSCSGLVCTLETYKDKVKITFAKGASLTDGDGLFNASLDAGTRRAIDIRDTDNSTRTPWAPWSGRQWPSTGGDVGLGTQAVDPSRQNW